MVKVVVCPTVHVPDAVRGGAAHKQGQKRARGDMGWSEEASSYRAGGNNSSSSSGGGSGNKRGRFNDRDRGDGHELKALFSSVKDLSATALAGLKKKEHKEDKLTKLGAPPGACTIPFNACSHHAFVTSHSLLPCWYSHHRSAAAKDAVQNEVGHHGRPRQT